jgi:molybdate transport system ATP-binding protein
VRELSFDLRGRFGGFQFDVRAALPAHGVTALIGQSGSGKTTLLRCLAGLARANGVVRLGDAVWQDGERFLPTHRRGVGYVFQEPSLLSHLSVKGNLRFAARRAPPRAGLGFDEVVQMMGVAPLLDRAPYALSGGERQRVAIARALLSKPELLLMDEPLSSLDEVAKAELLTLLDQLHGRLSLPVIYVSHDVREVNRLADRVLKIAHGHIARPAAPVSAGDPLAHLREAEVRALARAALAAGLDAGT